MTDISKIAKEMANSYDSSAISAVKNELALPDKNEIISVLDDIKKLFFPSYFASGEVRGDSVGFADSKSFCRVFKNIMGESAGSFKKKTREN